MIVPVRPGRITVKQSLRFSEVNSVEAFVRRRGRIATAGARRSKSCNRSVQRRPDSARKSLGEMDRESLKVVARASRPYITHKMRVPHQTKSSEVFGMKRTGVEFPIQPTEDPKLCRAERFHPAVEKKVRSSGRGRYLLRFPHYRIRSTHIETIG
jgi:hypothetical protein